MRPTQGLKLPQAQGRSTDKDLTGQPCAATGSVWPAPAQLNHAQVHQWKDFRSGGGATQSAGGGAGAKKRAMTATVVTKPPSLVGSSVGGRGGSLERSSRTVTITSLVKKPAGSSSQTGGSYEKAERMALRFLNPPSHHHPPSSATTVTAPSFFEVTGIEAIECLDQKTAFDLSKSELIGTNHSVVAKFLPNFDREFLLSTGTLNDAASSCDIINGPSGPGFYFPNTFSGEAASGTSSNSPDRSSLSRGIVTPHRDGSGEGEYGELLLCEVAQGSICLNPGQLSQAAVSGGSSHLSSSISSPTRLSLVGRRASGSTTPTQIAAATNTSSSSYSTTQLGETLEQVRGSLRNKGYDSVAASVLGQAHVAVFDTDVILPTHIISFYRPPKVGEAASVVGSSEGGAKNGNTASTVEDEGGTNQADKGELDLREWIDNEKSAIKMSAKQVRDMVHQRCADLEQSIRARRDSLIAQVRKAEESELSGLAKLSAKATGCSTVPACYQEEQKNIAAAHGIRAASVDTSRIMALLETLDIQGLNPPMLSRPGSSRRPTGATVCGGGSDVSQQGSNSGGLSSVSASSPSQLYPSRPSTSSSAVRPPLAQNATSMEESQSRRSGGSGGSQRSGLSFTKPPPVVKANSPSNLVGNSNALSPQQQRGLGTRPATSPGPGKPPPVSRMTAGLKVMANGAPSIAGDSNNVGSSSSSSSSLAKPLWGKGSGPRQLAQATGRKPVSKTNEK